MIRVENVSKTFKLFRKPFHRLYEALLRRHWHTEHHALRDVSFAIGQGESIGIIGPNGAGKSTLLRILTGVTIPDEGSIHIEKDGRIALLAIGMGFNDQLSGWDNIAYGSRILGLSDGEIEERRAAIAEFAELGRFIHEPMATYSTGMAMRLGFSVAIHAEPACFVVDEALSVGDAYFSAKCIERIKDFRERGGSLVLVSHDLSAVQRLCDRAILLHGGEVLAEGDPESVCNHYNFLVARLGESGERFRVDDHDSQDGYGTLAVEIEDVEIVGEHSRGHIVASGESIAITVKLRSHEISGLVTVGMALRDKYGQEIYGTNTYHLGRQVHLEAGRSRQVVFSMINSLSPGKYSLTVAVHTDAVHTQSCYHWRDGIAQLIVQGYRDRHFTGLTNLGADVSMADWSD